MIQAAIGWRRQEAPQRGRLAKGVRVFKPTLVVRRSRPGVEHGHKIARVT
jgi:hypothetical protein